MLSDKGDQSGALAAYGEAIKIRATFHHAFVARGILRCDLGDLEGAMKDYNEAIRLQPGFGATFRNRGLLREKMGDQAGAKKDFAEARRLGFRLRRNLGVRSTRKSPSARPEP